MLTCLSCLHIDSLLFPLYLPTVDSVLYLALSRVFLFIVPFDILFLPGPVVGESASPADLDHHHAG